MRGAMELLSDLNSAQQEAVTFGNGPLLIVAGAGTGKTSVITRRIAWLIAQKKAKPEEILALTFTDKAASEMEERVDKLLPYVYVNLWVSTFHAFGERILRDWALQIGLPNDFKVLTVSQQWMLVRNNLERFALNYYRPLGNPTKFIHALLSHFSRAKDEIIAPENYLKYVRNLALDKDSDTEIVSQFNEIAEAYHIYSQLLLEKDAFDFGDLINHTLTLLHKRPRVLNELRKRFRYILVDEFQDTNIAQYELIKLLAAPNNNLTVVGDDDQSIYKFRGASISNILQFTHDFPQSKKVLLTTNYRSYQNILDIAHTFIQQNNPYRLEVTLSQDGQELSKKLIAHRKGSAEVAHLAYRTVEDEAEGVAKRILALHNPTRPPLNLRGGEEGLLPLWSDFAILLRANSSAPIFLQALRRHNIPFDYVANKGLYKETIILDILSYLKLLDNYHESEALYRVLSTAPFALPHSDLVALVQYAGKKTISLYSALQNSERPALSDLGAETIARLLDFITKHAALARAKSASELYVQVVHDLDIEARVEHPALVREAEYLAEFYKRIQEFERDSDARALNAFLKHLQLELDSGEEGQLPADFEEGPDTVKVTTVHASKGLEWRCVFIPHLIDRRFPSTERREPIELPTALIKETLPEGDVHLQEERRLFYVAMTRARDGLYLTRAEDYLGKTTRKPSRFLYELGILEKDTVKRATKIPPPQSSPTSGRGSLMSLPSPSGRGQGEGAHYPIPESFSFSSVSAFRKCPLEYKFKYLLKLPSAGSAQLSFGNTIHKTLELFLKLWQERLRSAQGDLFDSEKNGKISVPMFEELKTLYERSWIDDWYESATQKNEYRAKRGPAILKNFYEHFIANPPKPKYIEPWFKIAMGPYKFVGKIDRIDVSPSPCPLSEGKGNRRLGEGCIIIDYKTGESAHDKLQKVDKEQLVIYQIAAQEFLRERVGGLMYWDLVPNHFTEPFVATPEQIEKLRSEYTAQIDEIIRTIENDSFVQAHADTTRHTCNYQHFL